MSVRVVEIRTLLLEIFRTIQFGKMSNLEIQKFLFILDLQFYYDSLSLVAVAFNL